MGRDMRGGGRIGVAGALLFVAALLGAAGPAHPSVRHPSWHQPAAGLPAAPAASGIPVAVGATVTEAGGVTRLVVDLSAPVAMAAVLTEGPDRLVIDLPEINVQVDPAAGRLGPRGVGVVRAFRFGLFAPGRSRIVADLAGPVALRRAEVVSIAGGDASRLTVELSRSDRAAFHAAARRPEPGPADTRRAVPVADGEGAAADGAATPDRRPVVVIDPGHGGIDPGASGVLGAVEKDVVLGFSSALAARLSAGGHYRVVMTRHDDSFVSLSARVGMARDAEAALFISVHADTLSDGSVTGATVYTASDRASDAEAARVAATENQADAAAGLDDAPKAAEVSDILFDLARRETRTYAHQFQHTLTGYWAKIARLNRNPERAAGFKVLQAPDVPSVLLELGYLSSGQDVRTLGSAEWRAKAVDGVSAAVDAFFAGRGAPPPGDAAPPAAPPPGSAPPGPAAMR